MESNPTRMCEILVGLPDVNVLWVKEDVQDGISVCIESRGKRPECAVCGETAYVKERPEVELVDLPSFGRRARLLWRKHRWECSVPACTAPSWTGEDPRIAAPNLGMTDRAGRWATRQVGANGRSVNEVASELGCDWHSVNTAMVAYGTPLVDDPERIGKVTALGLDDLLFVRRGPWKLQQWATSIVDVNEKYLLEVVDGRTSAAVSIWLQKRDEEWRKGIVWGTMDLSGPYRKVFTTVLPHVIQVADPFHVVKLANTQLDQCRRRVQNYTVGHRGRKDDPLYRCRRLLTKAQEKVGEYGEERLQGLLRAGDPDGEVSMAWLAKEAVREIYVSVSPELALEWVTNLGSDMQADDKPIEVRALGRTITHWKKQIAAWHTGPVSNGPTEGMNNLIKRVKRVAFGFTNFTNYRIRALLYAGRPNWSLLSSVVPIAG